MTAVQLLKVLADVLIRQVAAQEDAVDFTILVCEVLERAFLLSLLEELVQSYYGLAGTLPP